MGRVARRLETVVGGRAERGWEEGGCAVHVAWRLQEWHTTAQRSMAPNSTVRLGTAQRSAAQHCAPEGVEAGGLCAALCSRHAADLVAHIVERSLLQSGGRGRGEVGTSWLAETGTGVTRNGSDCMRG